MTNIVTKEMVELYTLGVLTPDRQRQVEAAFDASPQVQEWFLELDELPTHIKEKQLRIEVLDHFAEYRGSLANDSDRALFELAAAHASATHDSPEPSRAYNLFARLAALIDSGSPELGAALTQLACAPYGMIRSSMNFTDALSGAEAKSPTFPSGPEGKDICEQHGDDICIRCDVSCIPHGLAWLGITEADGTVTMHVPKLVPIDNHWEWRALITDLLDVRDPVSPVDTFVLPATWENRAAFECDKVRRFIGNLPAESEQRRRAEKFMAMEGDAHE